MKVKKLDWIIHIIANDAPCSVCGSKEQIYLDGIADVHTHGMDKYDHPEFQIVLAINHNISGSILNNLGFMVQDGRKFAPGEFVEGVNVGFPVRLDEQVDSQGKKLLRVVLPDPDGKFPGEIGCHALYERQAFPLHLLERSICRAD